MPYYFREKGMFMEKVQKAKSYMLPSETDPIVIYSIKALINRYKEDALSQTGAQLAYFFVLSLFPFLMLLNQAIAFFDYDIIKVLEEFERFIPPHIVAVIHSYVLNLAGSKSTGVFTFGAISTIFLASKATQYLITALNKAFRMKSSIGIVRVVISFLFTLMLILLIPISIVFSSIGKALFKKAALFLGIGEGFVNLWPYIRFLVPLSGVVLVLTVLYNIIPHRGFPRRYTLVGAIFAISLWIVMAIGISYYTSNFGRYSLIYGSLGAVMIMLLFLYWSGIIIVLGGELTHILAMRSIQDYSYDVKKAL